MITKDDERKALDKIRKIVEGLGKDSYVATAFEGCFDIAEDNINNDMACSMKQRYEMADRDAWTAQEEVANARVRIKELESELEQKDQKIEELASKVRIAKKERDEMVFKVDSLTDIKECHEEELEYKDAEILKLKARLYDLLCGQQ